MSNSNAGTGSGATTGSSWKHPVAWWVIRVFVVIMLAVVLLVMATLVWNSWRATYAEQESGQVAALRELASAAVSAANVANQAIYDKLNADKVLLDKIRVEQGAESKAAEDSAVAVNLKNEKNDGATKGEETAKASRDAANEAKKERMKAETAASQALVAVAAAKKSLQETVSANFSPNVVQFVVLFLLLVSLFPLSAIAFMRLEVPSLLAQLKIDYKMLGSQGRALPSTSTWDSPSAGTGDSAPISNRWNGSSYFLHCGLAVLVTAAGAALFFRKGDDLLDVDTQRGMQLGFLGAYVYCLNLVYRRYTTRDLAPHVYLSCAVGLIAGMIFNYVAFSVITSVATPPSPSTDGFTGVGAGAAAILAFSLGYFPNLAIRWFGRISRTSVHERQRRSDALPLSLIDGISELHESRLQDEGIDNVQNLAAVDIQDMVAKTPFSAHEIVEWVDQAVLYLYVDPGEIESFRKAGVRSVSDFRDIWTGFSVQYKLQPDGTSKRVPVDMADDFKERRTSIAQQLATTEQRLDCLFRATAEGPNMELVRTYWNNCQNAAIETRNLLINQVCGGVGRALRESMRDSDTLKPDEILKQVAEELFLVTQNNVEPTAESLYGQAYLKNKLGRIAEARELLEQCTVSFPNDPVAFNDLAWLDLQTRHQRSALETARTNAQKAIDLAKKSTPPIDDLAAYLDTLALAEIRLGNLDEGVKRAKEAIVEWDKLGRGTEPRFLETLMSAAEDYLSKGNREKAQGELNFVVGKNYANAKTRKRIDQMQKALAAPAS